MPVPRKITQASAQGATVPHDLSRVRLQNVKLFLRESKAAVALSGGMPEDGERGDGATVIS